MVAVPSAPYLQAYLSVWAQQGATLFKKFPQSSVFAPDLRPHVHRSRVSEFVKAQDTLLRKPLFEAAGVREGCFNGKFQAFALNNATYSHLIREELDQFSFVLNVLTDRLSDWHHSPSSLRPPGTESSLQWFYQLISDRTDLAIFSQRLAMFERSAEYYFTSEERKEKPTANLSASLKNFFGITTASRACL